MQHLNLEYSLYYTQFYMPQEHSILFTYGMRFIQVHCYARFFP